MSQSNAQEIDFSNTQIAFSHLSDLQLRQAYLLFRVIGQPTVVKLGPTLADLSLSLKLPIKTLIKKTIFSHFCGGETITACSDRIARLAKFGIGTILDFAREGGGRESDFDSVAEEIKKTIDRAADDKNIPFAVFKPTGVASIDLLAKVEKKLPLTAEEKHAWTRVQARFASLCAHAAERKVRLMIDAEESWIQDTVDSLVHAQMELHNRSKAIIFNTVQLYRNDRNTYLEKLSRLASERSFHAGVKLVRGAYLEKENKLAAAEGRPSPLNPNKSATDQAYDTALHFCVERLDHFSIVAGTHNEASVRLLTQLVRNKGLSPQDPRIFFAQLLGMSDNLSFNLAAAGFNVAKYVPYGTVAELLPYLTRRAQENSSVAGQSSRELTLLETEILRRKTRI